MPYLKQTLQALSKETKKVILTGDLNINLLNFDKNEVNEFLDIAMVHTTDAWTN